jgi:hypothetical protein
MVMEQSLIVGHMFQQRQAISSCCVDISVVMEQQLLVGCYACHIAPSLYNQLKEGNETVSFTERQIMLKHAYIYPVCLRYFGLLGNMSHCSLLILIFILSSKRAKWNCHLSFYNLRDQLLPSIYPWLWNCCLAINNSSLLVSADMSQVPVAWQRPSWNIFPQIFRPFGQNATCLPAYTLPYTIR